MSKRGSISSKQLNKINELNKRIAKKKSNLKYRHGLIAEVEEIDINASASERKKQMQKAESFLNPYANSFIVRNEHGVQTTKRQWNEMNKIVKASNRVATKEHNEMLERPYIVDGEIVGKLKDVLPPSALELKTIDNPFPFVTSINAFEKLLQKRKVLYGKDYVKNRQELHKENYIKGLKEHFGDTTDVRPLIQFIRGLDAKEFYIRTTTNAGLAIRDIYDPRAQDEALESLYTDWGLSSDNRTYDPKLIDPTDTYLRDQETGAHLESYFSRRQGLSIMESARKRMNVKKRR